MAWEYLSTPEFDKRYEVVASFLGDRTVGKTILELNCGKPGLHLLVNCKRYIANDINVPENAHEVEFIHAPDDKVDIFCDILCIFGGLASLATRHPMESRTDFDSIIRLSKYSPELIVLETAQMFWEKHDILNKVVSELPEYKVVFERDINIEPVDHYHNKRRVVILEHCGKLRTDQGSTI